MFHRIVAITLLVAAALVHAAPNPPATSESKAPAPAPSNAPASSVKPVNNVGAGVAMMINTPSTVLECQPVQFSWTGGLGPYYLAIIPGDQPFAPPMRRFPTQNGTTFTWTADLPSGTKFNLLLRDSTGAQAYSATVAEQEGNDKSCEKPITAVPQPGATSAPAASGAVMNGAVNAAANITSGAHPTATASLITSAASATAHKSAAVRAIGETIRGVELLWVFTMGVVAILML
ncbi:hypothetical protein PENSPDRAFT_640490 [Peniophora sp. CONT]|nr:hypothetical protein PENSPDRAFT_640490 [Peniophora sp. CONT]